MKQNHSVVAAIVSLIVLFILASCTKEPFTGSANSNSQTSGLPALTDPAKMFGMISGAILPTDAKAEIQLYTEFDEPRGIYYPARDGSFSINFVPAGNYHFYVHPYNPDYLDEKRYLVVITGETTFVKVLLKDK